MSTLAWIATPVLVTVLVGTVLTVASRPRREQPVDSVERTRRFQDALARPQR